MTRRARRRSSDLKGDRCQGSRSRVCTGWQQQVIMQRCSKVGLQHLVPPDRPGQQEVEQGKGKDERRHNCKGKGNVGEGMGSEGNSHSV